MLHDPTAAGALLRIRPGAGWRSHTETIPADDPATMLLGDERLKHLKKVQEYNEALRRFYERKFALKYLQGTRWIKEAEGAGWVMRTERGIAPTDKFGDSPVAEKMKE